MTQKTAMDRYVAGFANREEMAAEYARLLRLGGSLWPTWTTLNLAIIDRWSMSDLQHIKREALVDLRLADPNWCKRP